MPADEAFLRGVLCNVLVCLAVWLCFAARTVPGKVFAIIAPISAFVALGLEHSVANMYLIPVGMLAGAEGISVWDMIVNLVPVTLGNIVGGAVLVASVYWMVYCASPRGNPQITTFRIRQRPASGASSNLARVPAPFFLNSVTSTWTMSFLRTASPIR